MKNEASYRPAYQPAPHPVPTIEIIPTRLTHDGEKLLVPGKQYNIVRGFAQRLLDQGLARVPGSVRTGDPKSRTTIPTGSSRVTRVRVRRPFRIALDISSGIALAPGDHTIPVEWLEWLDPDRVHRLDKPSDFVKDNYGKNAFPIYRGVPASAADPTSKLDS